MSLTITGIILIPLGLAVMLMPWRYCLIALIVFAMMSRAAVVNIGSFGFQPGSYLSVLLVLRTFVEVAFDHFRLDGFVLTRLRALLAFLAICFAVLAIAIAAFQGRVDTLPGTAGFKSIAVHPFHLGRENFTQLAYLILNIALVYAMGHQGGRRRVEEMARDWDFAMVSGLLFSAFVCVWQFMSLYRGVPFPRGFFYSSATATAETQTMGGLFRLNGPFDEPSALGYMFTGYLLFAWLRYRRDPSALSAILIVLCLFCMMASTSTTAFAGIAFFGCLVLYDIASGKIHLLTKRISRGQAAAIAIGIAGVSLGLVLATTNWQEIGVILRNTVFEKSESSSFQERSYADFLAARIFVETYGIGIGLGSHKANSLILSILSNTGIVGLVVLAAFFWTLLQPRSANGSPLAAWGLRAMAPFQWGLAGLLFIHVISNPNLSVVGFWVQIGGLLSVQAALRRATAQAAVSPPPPQRAVATGGRLALPRRG